MILTDSITIDDAAVKETREGFLTASARVARTGTQQYLARELGSAFKDRDPNSRVTVYRPADQVFDKKSVQSFSSVDLTIDHPSEPIDSRNWKRHAVGNTGESAMRDGEYLVLPLILKDADAIDAWRNGKRELSVGYSCDIIAQDGVAEDGTPYEAIQTNIVANHVSYVGRARGGSSLKFGDHSDGGPIVATKTIQYDGLPVEVTDAAEAVINKQAGEIKRLNDAAAEAATAAGAAAATIATKDGEIAALNAKLKDAEVTPERLAALVESRAAVVDQARAIMGDAASFDGKSEQEIRKAAVAHKLGDAAANLDDNGINGAFLVIAADSATGADPVAKIVGKPVNVGDAAAQADNAFQKANADLNAWRNQGDAN